MSSEFELIEAITEALPSNDSVLLGPGDDAAVLRFSGAAVVSTDILVESVHFRRDWSSAAQIGRKAIAVNVSDVEAMGANPRAVVVSLAIPQGTERDWILDFAAGVREECTAAGVALVGGDLSGSPQVVVNVTVLGESSGQVVTRAGARPGDVVAITGRLGWAGAGHAALSRGFRSPVSVVQAALVPEVAYGAGARAAAAGARAMIDVSDGLLQDLGHIAGRSGVAIDVHSAALEIAEPIERVAVATGRDPLSFVLCGGEDYALAAAFPPEATLPDGWRAIGSVDAGTGVTVDGEAHPGTGWDHFS
ncbi:thiamine-phosphate kinase [Tessaracoccus sp. OH4464_COT-324]|uniref:thiamine-phosphate kinase n=1 Tax=Tessaracoccus sp. OH4464_COT-324 TaxID=2491059 RepID=UPI000F63956C|nr:thiamine-phosphate kinase [Tessaracoccus sp. OH4464_COT-324]RRD47497.1 thiamine-phosphate kinase [Tessaracoccus sp. OH4464_COT-324]